MRFLQNFDAKNRLCLPSTQWRLVIGAMLGILQGALALAISSRTMPFIDPLVSKPLTRLLFLLPLILLLDLGRMRWPSLLLLMILEALIGGGTMFHEAWQDPFHDSSLYELSSLIDIFFWLLVFIVQVMAFAADRDRRWIPRYATLFEVAWDQTILLALASLFTALTWGILPLRGTLPLDRAARIRASAVPPNGLLPHHRHDFCMRHCPVP